MIMHFQKIMRLILGNKLKFLVPLQRHSAFLDSVYAPSEGSGKAKMWC